MKVSFSIIYFFILPWLGFGKPIKSSKGHNQKLLIVSYDAFRPEYLKRNVTPYLNKFAKEGTFAPHMINVFPTKTFVNHHSIATGFYPEVHGVTANEIYDQKLGRLGYSYDLFHYDESLIPIWIANEINGKTSGCMMWPGSDYLYNNHSCTFLQTFNESIAWKDRVDMVMSWFTDEETPMNLGMLYIEEPDAQAHMYGPESDVVTKTVAKLDDLTGYIQQQLTAHNLEDVNVIHLSDHGMSSVSPPNFIDLRKFSTKDAFKWYGSSPVLQIVPNENVNVDELYKNMTKAAKKNGHFKIYNEKNMPTRWHVNNTRRLGPLLAVADMDYAFHDMIKAAESYEKKFNIPFTNESKYGVHGYDNMEELMHAIFMAKGPIFNTGKQIKPVNMIDLYNLFCFILDLNCNKNNGSDQLNIWNELFLEKPVPIAHKKDSIFVWVSLTIIIFTFIAALIYQRKRKTNMTTNYTIRIEPAKANDDVSISSNDETRKPLIHV